MYIYIYIYIYVLSGIVVGVQGPIAIQGVGQSRFVAVVLATSAMRCVFFMRPLHAVVRHVDMIFTVVQQVRTGEHAHPVLRRV